MKNNILRTLLAIIIAIPLPLLIGNKSMAKELQPNFVIRSMYAGVAKIYGYNAVPRIYKPIRAGSNTGCGAMAAGNAIYCKLDHSIYITTDMVKMAYQYGDAALAYVVGHEYAHAMQNAYQFNSNNSPISELQADCLAGFYMAAVPNLVFDDRDVQEIRAFAYSLGDNNVWSQDHHGTPLQRVQAVTIGLGANNILACKI
jgi:uncharacterized protein